MFELIGTLSVDGVCPGRIGKLSRFLLGRGSDEFGFCSVIKVVGPLGLGFQGFGSSLLQRLGW